MIEQAIRLVAVDPANCAFVVSASESLPFADGSFDFAVALIVL
jgi:ubiquinone/menaquinone biosynthesis C-methylase UbiE